MQSIVDASLPNDRLTLVDGLRDGAMIAAAGLAWFTGSKIVAGAVAFAFALSLYDDWRKNRRSRGSSRNE